MFITLGSIVFIIGIFASCDYFDKTPDHLVGEIYLTSSANSQYLIYGENYSKDGVYSFLLNEPVLSVFGNDSILYVKTDSNEIERYYFVNHVSGRKILSTRILDSSSYTKLVSDKHFDIHTSPSNSNGERTTSLLQNIGLAISVNKDVADIRRRVLKIFYVINPTLRPCSKTIAITHKKVYAFNNVNFFLHSFSSNNYMSFFFFIPMCFIVPSIMMQSPSFNVTVVPSFFLTVPSFMIIVPSVNVIS
jgi:hypothetical protein